MEAYSFTGSRSVVHVALYTHVTNAAEVRKRIIAAANVAGAEGDALRDAVNFAYIDARLITSRLHLQTAIYQALLAESEGALRTRTVHSEVIWALNPSNNITEALRRYGISDTTTSVIVVSMDGALEAKMGAGIAGTQSPLEDIETDWEAVRKVATTILHSTTRAVTSIQHQSYTIKNVLSGPNNNLAPWNTPSYWEKNGPGPGGQKYGAGSRYGYTGVGRAVTQANTTIFSDDGSFSQSDEHEEVVTRRPAVQSSRRATRARSNSLSIPVHERGETLGVLKTVQLHARSRHAFAPQVIPSPPLEDTIPATPRPLLVRRNSTSALAPTEAFDPSIPAPSPQPSRAPSPAPSKPPSPKPPVRETTDLSHAAQRLISARDSGDSARAAAVVRDFRQNVVHPNVREFNSALEALQATRRIGEPLNLMLDTYNDMLRHSLLPNIFTYIILIDALASRDHEIHNAITALQGRVKHRTLTSSSEVASDTADQKRIEMLRRETNFTTAMSLFETALSIGGNSRLPPRTYYVLLRSCAYHGNVNAAIHIFAQQEKRENVVPTHGCFVEMIRVYTNAGQLQGAEEIFAEYRQAIKRGSIHLNWAKESVDTRRECLLLWNQMIETYFRFDRPDMAIALVDQMLNTTSTDTIPDPPPVSSSTFTTVLTGFCQTGDVATALVWFDRLLAQSPGSPDPYEATGKASKPDDVAWNVMLDALAVKGMVDDLNRLFAIRLQDSNVRNTERMVVYACNMAHLQSMPDEQFLWTLDFLQNHVLNTPHIKIHTRTSVVADMTAAYLERKFYDKALSALSSYCATFLEASTQPQLKQKLGQPPPIGDVQSLLLNFTQRIYEVSHGNLPYTLPMDLARTAGTVRVSLPPAYTPYMLQSYALARASETLPIDSMTLRDWELLVMAASEVEHTADSAHPEKQHTVLEYAFGGLDSLLRDLKTYNVPFDDMNAPLIRKVIAQITRRLGFEGVNALFAETGFKNILHTRERSVAALQGAIDETASLPVSDFTGSRSEDYPGSVSWFGSTPETVDGLRVDGFLSKSIMDDLKSYRAEATEAAYTKFTAGVEQGRVPAPAAMSLLVQILGRLGRMEAMHHVYSVAQRVLSGLEGHKEWQTEAWFQMENGMVIGLAHHGDVEGAHVHKLRMMQQGGAPDADAYGALIYNVKDTTDDASNALELFHEAMAHRVAPNHYLYNNIISKLARARKADYALELFQQMKAAEVVPSSVTFGAVIGACARVGDVHSAELLFTEMTQARNFKPRIPPYNTMIQMYTTTKPDRARVLFFYDALCKVNIAPTAHTYKLLLDAYGSIEPIDIASMNKIFEQLQADKNVPVQGTHYASLINAHGCVSKDLTTALKIFNTIPVPADSIVYETIINVLATHRRADLFPEYVNMMHLAGVHMTAYIANSLIKGYALLDKLSEAREVFEKLDDPPVGVAAPNNHAPHSPAEASPVDQSSPVYREPSTWEVMIRAELGAGNRNGALDLLERLKTIPRSTLARRSFKVIPRALMPSEHSDEPEAGPSRLGYSNDSDHDVASDAETSFSEPGDLVDGMDPEGFSGPSEKTVKPITREALEEFKRIQDRAGVLYISRIPPGMRPTKVRHLMSMHGEVGRVYLQQEDAKRAYLRKKYTATKKAHFTEGWVEFKDKKVARTVADMLNAQPIGGKKGTRWRDDVWTMKYLPKFKWNMLTEQVAHEAAIHAAKLRVELSQSRAEQQDYLKNVELARVLEKRAGKKREKGEELQFKPLRERPSKKRQVDDSDESSQSRKKKKSAEGQLDSVLSSIF
ncbi:hypothetical protein C0991_003085 [Blastosporella zonata]|nr:hypothetical protein C0991_003085 [Blastosporella zonata]